MKKLLLVLPILLAIACKKDGISPKDEKNGCADCILIRDTDFFVNDALFPYDLHEEITLDEFNRMNPKPAMSWCDYLHSASDYNKTYAASKVTYSVKCN